MGNCCQPSDNNNLLLSSEIRRPVNDQPNNANNVFDYFSQNSGGVNSRISSSSSVSVKNDSDLIRR